MFTMTTSLADRFAALEPPRGPRRHLIEWFIHDDVEVELTCLDEPLTNEHHRCDCDAVKEEGVQFFIDSFDGDRTPLRNGIIDSWWKGSDEDAELYWKYVEASPVQGAVKVS